MNGTILAGEPSYTTGDAGNAKRGIAHDVGFSFVILLFITTLGYIFYMYKHRKSSTPPPPAATFHTHTDSDSDDFHCIRFSSGLTDNILSTFPTFYYSETINPNKCATEIKDRSEIDYGSGCSICLADYKTADVLRLLPECGHLFHVSCIDTWLKAQPTCPVCRNVLSSSELT